MRGVRWGGWGWLLAASVMIAASLGGSAETHAVAAPLKLGLMMNFSQGATGRAFERQRAFELAIKHVNAGGGVLGQPVMAATADTARDPLAAVAAARRLIEVEGVHAIVGPASSAVALAVAQQVTGPAGIPTISPSATSPELTVAADGDYLFRTALSDTAQGPVLARVTRERGFDNVGLLYRDDAWGRGLAGTFAGAWDGAVTAVAFEPGQTGFAAELPRSAAAGAQALVVVAGEQETVAILRGAIKRGLYRRFIFGDASKSPCVALEVGAEHLHGMYGTAGAAAPESATAAAWRAAYVAEHGAPPVYAYVRETYDAAIALALAAQAAGSTRGDAIRDRLRDVGGAPGVTVNAGAEGVAAALRILAEGGEVNYEGAAATLDWDRHGDLRRGHIGVWRFTRDGRIEDLEAVPLSTAWTRRSQNQRTVDTRCPSGEGHSGAQMVITAFTNSLTLLDGGRRLEVRIPKLTGRGGEIGLMTVPVQLPFQRINLFEYRGPRHAESMITILTSGFQPNLRRENRPHPGGTLAVLI